MRITTEHIMNQNSVLENGYYGCCYVNTKGHGFPKFITEFLRHHTNTTEGIFQLSRVFDLTANLEKWRGYFTDIEPGDTLYQIMIQLKGMDMAEEDHWEYLNMMWSEHIIPFFTGCNFQPLEMNILWQFPAAYMGTCSEGTNSVEFLGNNSPTALKKMLGQIFELPEPVVDMAFELLEQKGSYLLTNSIPDEMLPKMQELFTVSGIKYNIL